jgi:hypothetical protein
MSHEENAREGSIRHFLLGSLAPGAHTLWMMNAQSWSVAVVLVAAAAAPAGAGEGVWIGVSLHKPEWFGSSAYGTRDGQQVGEIQLSASDSGSRAVIWSGSAGSALALSDQPTRAHGIGGGEQVGGSSSGQARAMRWSGTPGSLVSLHPEGHLASYAVCTDGTRQGGYTTPPGGGRKAAVWSGSAGSVSLLAPADATDSRVNSVDAGLQVGYVQYGQYPGYTVHAAAWRGTAGTFVNLSPGSELGQVYGSAICVHNGRICGSLFVGGTPTAVVWEGTTGAHTSLHPAGRSSSVAYGIYNNLQVGETTYTVPAGGGSGTTTVTHAAFWTGSAASHVDLHSALPSGGVGYVGSSAYSVWTDGSTVFVAGRAVLANGRSNAVLWTQSDGPAQCGPADLGRAGGEAGADGALDNNDFIVFIGSFFDADSAADFGSAGGEAGADGAFDNNDFIAFIGAFFDGCS